MRQSKASGEIVNDESLAHISPAHSEQVNTYGGYTFDVDLTLAELGPAGYRPLPR